MDDAPGKSGPAAHSAGVHSLSEAVKCRWLVYTEMWTLFGASALLLGLKYEPAKMWRYYRWRWLARLVVWADGFPKGIAAVVGSRLFGRVIVKD